MPSLEQLGDDSVEALRHMAERKSLIFVFIIGIYNRIYMNLEIVVIDIMPSLKWTRRLFPIRRCSFESISNNWLFLFAEKTDNALIEALKDPQMVNLLNNERFLCFKIDPISTSVEHVEKIRILLYFTISIWTAVFENRNV